MAGRTRGIEDAKSKVVAGSGAAMPYAVSQDAAAHGDTSVLETVGQDSALQDGGDATPAPQRRELDITTSEQLDIYMNPQRQRLLREMALIARPATCKELADRLGISASSVTHHMKKLEQLGLVLLDHTERIRGVVARFWAAPPTNVNVRMGIQDDLHSEKSLLVDYLHQAVYDQLRRYVQEGSAQRDEARGVPTGDLRTGFVYLTEEEARELQDVVTAFLVRHDAPRDGAVPWEFSLMWVPHRADSQAGDTEA